MDRRCCRGVARLPRGPVVASVGFPRCVPLWFFRRRRGGGVDLAVLLPLVFSAFAAVAVAALSLFDRRFVPVAAALGFAAGLNVNVLVGCVVAALLVWRPGPVRVGTIAAAV